MAKETPHVMRQLWAELQSNKAKVAEIKAQIIAHTGLKDLDGKQVSIKFLTCNTAGVLYYNDDEPVAFLSMDWADICLRITYVKW
jgi:hypothetical protein